MEEEHPTHDRWLLFSRLIHSPQILAMQDAEGPQREHLTACVSKCSLRLLHSQAEGNMELKLHYTLLKIPFIRQLAKGGDTVIPKY